jgi:YCII-related domain
MAQFVLLFVGRTAQPDPTDEQTADYNRQWGEYMGGLAQSGALVAGAPFEGRGKVVGRAGAEDLELKDVDIGGYLVVDVDSIDAAAEIAQGAPHIALGGTTIVRPCLPVG